MQVETAARRGRISREFGGLGTISQIHLYGLADPRLLDKAVGRVLEIDQKMSAFNPASEISALNRNAGRKPVRVSRETFLLLKQAREFGALSAGAFDPTVRPLVALWGINKKPDFIPAEEAIGRALKLVDFRGLELDEAECTARLGKDGQAADLGGIAKGYAADEVRRILAEGGAKSAVINLGGNIVTLGSRPDGSPWRIGVQNPASVRGTALGTLSVKDRSVVTSGSNERFFIREGVRYHHILDPRTGMPARSGLLSVTAVGESSMEADALSTAAFVLGMEKGTALLKKRRLEAVFATDDGKVYVTEGLARQFTML
jgi:thiamine biosynthesis lipoprotein